MKNLLLYNIQGTVPNEVTRIFIKALRESSFNPILVLDRGPKSEECKTYINAQWDYNLLLKIAREENIKGTVLLSDLATPLIGQLNKELNLAKNDSSIYHKFNNKQEWSALAVKNELSMPKEFIVTSEKQFNKILGPIFVKPTKSTGNICKEPYGYKYFHDINVFRKKLYESNLLEEFFKINKSGSSLGKYIIQEALKFNNWYCVNASIINGQAVVHEVSERLFRQVPNLELNYASFGPISITREIQNHIDRVLDILVSQVGFNDAGLSFDVVTTEPGNIYTLDVNARFSYSFILSCSTRGMTSFLTNWIESIYLEPTDLVTPRGYYLRQVIDCNTKRILKLEGELINDDETLLFGLEKINNLDNIPPAKGRSNWPAEIVLGGASIEACRKKFDRLVLGSECHDEQHTIL